MAALSAGLFPSNMIVCCNVPAAFTEWSLNRGEVSSVSWMRVDILRGLALALANEVQMQSDQLCWTDNNVIHVMCASHAWEYRYAGCQIHHLKFSR